jgi:hypothetical protein
MPIHDNLQVPIKSRMARHSSRLLYMAGERKEKARVVNHPGEIIENNKII